MVIRYTMLKIDDSYLILKILELLTSQFDIMKTSNNIENHEWTIDETIDETIVIVVKRRIL
ncbi:hypothetical protein CR513_36406, partial [Mucuna pruriens]